MFRFCRIFAIAIILLSVAQAASAQSVWKYMSRPDLTVGISAYNTTASGHTPGIDYQSHDGYAHYGAMFNFNIPFYELSQRASVGFMPGVALGISPTSQSDFGDTPQSADLSLPWFATFKYNNDATWKGGEGFQIGAAAGIGYSYHLFWAWGGYDDSHNFGNPCWMAELNFGERHSSIGILKIRYIGAIGSGYSSVTSTSSQTVDQGGSIYVGITYNY